MNPELYTLLMLYKNKELDDDFIYKAFDIMMKYETVGNYIDDFEIVEEEDHILGTYSNDEQLIEFNKKGVLNDESVSNKKILAMEVLRHEIEHARNLQRLYDQKNDIESRVVRYSLREYAIKHGLYYGSILDEKDPLILRVNKHGNYNIDPGERIAEIKGWKFMVNLLKNQRRTEDLLNARSMLYYSYIRGYKSNGYYLEPPTYEYLLTLGLYHEHYLLKKQFNNKNYNFNTRLLYGLPISKQEYDHSILQKVKLKKTRKS